MLRIKVQSLGLLGSIKALLSLNDLEIEKFVSAEEQPKKSTKYNKYKK